MQGVMRALGTSMFAEQNTEHRIAEATDPAVLVPVETTEQKARIALFVNMDPAVVRAREVAMSAQDTYSELWDEEKATDSELD